MCAACVGMCIGKAIGIGRVAVGAALKAAAVLQFVENKLTVGSEKCMLALIPSVT